ASTTIDVIERTERGSSSAIGINRQRFEHVVAAGAVEGVFTNGQAQRSGGDTAIDVCDSSVNRSRVAGYVGDYRLQIGQIRGTLLVDYGVVVGDFDFVQQSLFGVGPFFARGGQQQLYSVDDDVCT